MTTHQLFGGPVVAIRHPGTSLYMGEDDAGDPMFCELSARTYFFDPEDRDNIGAAMSAAPDGVEAVQMYMSLTGRPD